MFLLKLSFQQIVLKVEQELPQQISALDFGRLSGNSYLFVGEWLSNSIKILECEDLRVISELSLQNLQPRSSCILDSATSDPHLVVGTSIGSVVSVALCVDETGMPCLNGILSSVQIGRADVKLLRTNDGPFSFSSTKKANSLYRCCSGFLRSRSYH